MSLPTWVVFDGEIWIVEHLWDETEVKVVALDWVIFVGCSDSLDHLYWKQRDRKIKETGSHSLQQAAYSLHCFFPRRIASVIQAGSRLMKYRPYSFLDFEIIINEVLSSVAHFQTPGSIS